MNTKKQIKVYTNIVLQPWSPKDYETGTGGSEEKLIEWAKALSKDYDITIYMNGEHGDFDGVHYRDHKEFRPWIKHDIFISFKNKGILEQTINADKIFHWTTEIEEWKSYELDQVDAIFPISNYHKSRMRPQGNPKFVANYLWADFKRLLNDSIEKNITGNSLSKSEAKRLIKQGAVSLNGKKITDPNMVINETGILKIGKKFFTNLVDTPVKEKGSMLYSSSFDRGLEELLARWDVLKEKLNLNKLYITYGWDFFNKIARNNPQMIAFKQRVEQMMNRDDVVFLGRVTTEEMNKLYWKCEYWTLPLNNPDSELFCINAIKAQYCGCIPVVRRIGALNETVNEFIDFDALIGQKHGQDTFNKNTVKNNMEYIQQFSLDNGIKRWKEILEYEHQNIKATV